MLDALVFGQFELRPAQRLLLKAGERIPLGTRAFDMLSTLVEHRDRIVTKEELLGQVWHGLVVEENNLTVHISKLRKLLGTDAVTTVAGLGYRFTMPVFAPPASQQALPAEPPAVPTHPIPFPLPLPDKPSIAVLPFAGGAHDADQEDFIDGITDGLITELSRFHGLFVISRNSVFTYKHRHVDVRTVAQELGIRYVLEGNAHQTGTSIRIAARLIDAVTGHQIWAERYDRQLAEVFVLQDELVHVIVTAMAPYIEITELGHARRARLENVSAYELALHAWARGREGLSRSHTGARDDAVRLARQALALDPRCGLALNAIVDALSWHMYFGTAEPVTATLQTALDAVAQALEIDNTDHMAYRGRGWLMLVSGRLPDAISDFRRSLELNPNDPTTLARLGMCESVSGDFATGTRRCLEALRLSPRDPARFHLLDNLVWAQFAARSYLEAITTARQSLREADFAGTRLCLVLSLVGAGDLPEAAAELARLRHIAPTLVATRLSGIWLATDPDVYRREVDFLQAAHSFVPGAPSPTPGV